MQEKPIRIPGPDHPISVAPNPARVTVTVAGRVIADTRAALTLQEATYPAIQYLPRADVDMSQLERSAHTSYCPYKGECSYYSIPAGGERSVNAVWSYEQRYAAVRGIEGYLAFYRDRVGALEILPVT
jgi:uncharacterized protein (DUF427 family)